jgi:hypothetical protein
MAYEIGDVVLDESGDPMEILNVMQQEEGPAYWVRYCDSGMTTVRFSEEITGKAA